MTKQYQIKIECIEKNLPDFNNRNILRKFCERQYKACKKAIKDDEIRMAKSLERVFRYRTIG